MNSFLSLYNLNDTRTFFCLALGLHDRYMADQYMAEWIESWDLEAMTSYNREIGVRGPVGTSKLEFFHPGFTPTVFLH